MELQELLSQVAFLRAAGHSSVTITGYSSDWRLFSNWCAENGRCPCPADEETLCLYLAFRLSEGIRINTLDRQLTAINYMHRQAERPAPVTKAVREILRGARRIRKEKPQQRAALVLDALRRACAAMGAETPRVARDRAILLCGFASALRRRALAALDLADLIFDGRGVQLQVKREKQNQEGPPRIVALPFGSQQDTCPVLALQTWIRYRGTNPGPLFCAFSGSGNPSLKVRVSRDRVAKVVQESVAAIGLNPADYGAHSLRAGFVTEALERGINELAIARQTGHRSLANLRLYIRSKDPFRGNAAGCIGL